MVWPEPVHLLAKLASPLSRTSGPLRCNQMGAKFKEVFCDEHGTGGDGEDCGDNDAQLGRINVF